MHLTDKTKTTRVMNAVAAGTTSQTSSVIDMQGFDGCRFTALFGALTATQVTSLKVQQSDNSDGSSAEDLTGASTAALADGDGNKCLIVDVLRPTKRYLKAVVVRGTANAVIDGVIAEQYTARTLPTTQPTSVKEAVKVVNPAAA